MDVLVVVVVVYGTQVVSDSQHKESDMPSLIDLFVEQEKMKRGGHFSWLESVFEYIQCLGTCW